MENMENNKSFPVTVSQETAELVSRLEAADSNTELPRLLEALSKEEFALIGELVQTYCVADTLCRGLVAMLREERVGVPSDSAYLLNDADVLTHTRTEAEKTGLTIDTVGVISAVETLQMHRVFRHTFAHWIVRRHIGGQHLVAFTKNKSDAEKRDGIPLDNGDAKMMAFRIDELMAELVKIKRHCRFLSELHLYLEKPLTTC